MLERPGGRRCGAAQSDHAGLDPEVLGLLLVLRLVLPQRLLQPVLLHLEREDDGDDQQHGHHAQRHSPQQPLSPLPPPFRAARVHQFPNGQPFRLLLRGTVAADDQVALRPGGAAADAVIPGIATVGGRRIEAGGLVGLKEARLHREGAPNQPVLKLPMKPAKGPARVGLEGGVGDARPGAEQRFVADVVSRRRRAARHSRSRRGAGRRRLPSGRRR